MSDVLELRISGRRLDRFVSYRVDADLYEAADAFRLELADPGFEINAGERCELRVNGELELTGLIDRVEETGDKSGNTLTVEGRDLMGLLVDSCVEEYPDLQSVTLKTLAEQLLKNIPYVNRRAIVYQAGIAGASAAQTTAAAFDAPQANAHLDATRTVFDVLRDFAAARGAMFFALPDGTLVFGRPKAAGSADYQLLRRRDGRGNTILSGGRTRDLSQRYSHITVLGQQQGSDTLTAGQINTSATVVDDGVPFRKPLVVQNDNDGESPERHARLLLDKQRARALQFSYRAVGHSQAGRNWSINRLCHVRDEALRPVADGVYLITGRTFELSKEAGRVTELRLGLPGVIA